MGKAVALVTGASMGIGRALATRLAAAHRDVVLVARSEDKLRALASELEARHGVTAHVIACDLGTPEGIERVVDEVRGADLEVEWLVNNAGFGTNGRFWELELERELAQIRLNCEALVALTGRCLPGMVARGRGRVLNVASAAGFQPGPYMATYYATKAFVLSWSEAVGEELRGTGVTMTTHCPGPVATDFIATAGIASASFVREAVGAEQIADHAFAAMERGAAVVVPGMGPWLKAWSVRFAPRGVVRRVAAKMNRVS
jgi:short-subunit dehydrogenase